jgi:hypothetical protein
MTKTALFDACRVLFGEEIRLGPEFLAYLQPSGAKTAFRAQAKRHHPDAFTGAPAEVRARQTERFREIHQAYCLVNSFLARRPQRPVAPVVTPARHRRRAAKTVPEPARVPPIRLEFGLYAYYRQKIAYHDLIEALAWQRRQRPAIGSLACQWGWLTDTKVRSILAHSGAPGRFGQRAMSLGLLTPVQVDALLQHQHAHQQRLGQYFIERGLLSAPEADQLDRDLARHNSRQTAPRR